MQQYTSRNPYTLSAVKTFFCHHYSNFIDSISIDYVTNKRKRENSLHLSRDKALIFHVCSWFTDVATEQRITILPPPPSSSSNSNVFSYIQNDFHNFEIKKKKNEITQCAPTIKNHLNKFTGGYWWLWIRTIGLWWNLANMYIYIYVFLTLGNKVIEAQYRV